MLQNNYDPGPNKDNVAALDRRCPHCGQDMESIDSGTERPSLKHIQLCPGCYLVTWSDLEGIHMRQGVPATESGIPAGVRHWFISDPQQC